MGHVLKILCIQAAVTAMTFGSSATVDASTCRHHHCRPDRDGDGSGIYRYVTAEASVGFETVTAPVRPGRWGDQVRLPSGRWVDCEATCEYTLRKETVDFWELQSHHFLSPGYFRFDLDLDTGRVYRRRSY